MLKVYEGMFLLRTGEIASGSHVDLVRGIIEKRKGALLEVGKWDERKLAYEIDRNKRGIYILVYFEAPEESIPQIKRDCVLSEDVLRLLILRADPAVAEQKKTAASQGAPETEEPQKPKEEISGVASAAAGKDVPPAPDAGVGPGGSGKVTG